MTDFAKDREHVALELDYLRQQAALVDCPECAAPAGESCRNAKYGGPLAMLPHHKRLEAAECLP